MTGPRPTVHGPAPSGRRAVVWVALAGVALGAAGCTGKHTPPPTPTFPTVYISVPTRTTTTAPTTPASPTHTPTPTPTPTVSLYDQAVEVYNQYHEQDVKLQLAGGADTLPPEMAVLLTDRALTMTTQGFAALKVGGYHLVGEPTFQVVWARPYTKDLFDGTRVAIETCEALDGARWQNADGTQTDRWDHYLYANHYYFRYDDQHRLVIFALQGGAVETCPA